MISFIELTKQVHLINDIILSDMLCEDDGSSDRVVSFGHHLLATKFWFSRICWANKKRYLLALLEDVRSAWTLSLLLKSMWNCRPKDAVLSANSTPVWSSYDQAPMDHNRTAMPITALAQVMKNDRMWFLALDPEAQAMVLSELLTIAGGPVMWAVLRRAQLLYERYRDIQYRNLQECIVVKDPAPAPMRKESMAATDKGKKPPPNSPDPNKNVSSRAHAELEARMAEWNATIKALQDKQKLEELEMTFTDGTQKKIWMVNRPKPEATETVDFLQLLPSSVGMRVLSFLPQSYWGDFARVNRYWAYLVDELRAEQSARRRINADCERLTEIMLRHDHSLELVEQIDFPAGGPGSIGQTSMGIVQRPQPPPSMHACSEKSAGAYSFRHFLFDKPNKMVQKPVRNLADMYERLETRGAADENLWKWCETILRHAQHAQMKAQKTEDVADHTDLQEGVLPLAIAHFPCPLMKHELQVPLKTPLYKDPARIAKYKPRRNVSDSTVIQAPQQKGAKRFSLWTRDITPLYPIFKIPSYQSPI